jgi:PAS domain S-box-containing protein
MGSGVDSEPRRELRDRPTDPDHPETTAAAERQWRRDPAAWGIVLIGLAVLGAFALWVSRFDSAQMTHRLTSIATVPGSLLSVGLAFRASRSGRLDPQTRRAWFVIGVAFTSYFAGALLDYIAGSLAGTGVLPDLTTVLEVGAYPIAAWGVTMLPKARQARSDPILFGLDVAIVAWAAAMLVWHFVVAPVAVESGADLLATAAAAMYPALDLAFLFATLAVVLRGVRPSSAAALLAIGVALLLLFGADLISGIESLRDSSDQSGAASVVYSTASVVLALAAHLQRRPERSGSRLDGMVGSAYSFVWLPYVAVAVAFVAPAIRDWNQPDMLREHVPATGILIALVVARLGVTAWQNSNLAAAERERLAAAVDQAAEAMLMTDGAGSITYANPAFERITGFTAAEVVGHDPAFLRGDASEPERLSELKEASGRGEVWQGRLRYRRKNGTVVEVDVAVSPLRDAAGAPVGSVEVARDISRERALEAQLAQSQRMEAVGRLAGGIAHDFNNILTAISGFGELAAAQVESTDPVAADIAEIRKSADRATTLTRALLAFSRRQVMQPQVLDLNEVVDGITPMLGRLIGEDVDLVVRPDLSLGRTLADKGQFEQVIVNLAMNARDAMPGGGKLTIETANADLDGEYTRTHVGAVPGPHVMLAVSDTGVGMTPQVREHAFEPFFTTKGHGKGTGLGLSTVIGIVQQSGGFIDVHSEPGHGAVFSVYLPRVDAPSEQEAVPIPPDAQPRGNEIVLVAEDEEAVRRYVERVLSGAGYRVLVAANGQRALEVSRAHAHIDLLFTDMVMPGMSGADLAERLMATHPEVRVLYASGYTDDAIIRGNEVDASVPYVPKPFAAEVLLSRVREVLDRPRITPLGGRSSDPTR